MIGLGAGAALSVVSLLLPAATMLGSHEISRLLIFVGLPMVVASAAIGAWIGAPPAREADETDPEQAQRLSATVRSLLALTIIAMAALIVWWCLAVVGAVDGPPLHFA